MYFDFEDYRPDPPRIPTAISIREAVLVSVIAHLIVVIAYLLVPDEWFERDVAVVAEAAPMVPPDQRPLRFVEVVPFVDRSEPPEQPSDLSDMDRRSATQERAPNPDNPLPFMQGNTPEFVQGGPPVEPPGPPPAPAPRPPAPPEVADASPLPPADRGFATLPPQPLPEAPAQTARSLGDSLRNLQQYLRQENFDNQRGGDTRQSADIQFDSMGVDFGPWLLRFKHQVERNWLVPAVAMSFEGRVVVRFVVHRNGYITDLEVLQPASVPALTNAAVNALRLSNPTAQLPLEYPQDRMPIIATFRYNEDPRSSP
jgi:TonB family protein